jgi:chaperonin GroES
MVMKSRRTFDPPMSVPLPPAVTPRPHRTRSGPVASVDPSAGFTTADAKGFAGSGTGGGPTSGSGGRAGTVGAVSDTPSPDDPAAEAGDGSGRRTLASSRTDKLPVKMLSDRILVNLEADGERRSTGGILIPATAQLGRRLAWGEVVAMGPSVRSMEVGDQVLFNPEDRYEVEVRGADYLILRERDIHAVAAKRLDEEGSTGLYL